MHSRLFVLWFMVAAVAVSAAAPRDGAQSEAGEPFAGVWSGSWEGGGGTGGFELTLTYEKGKPLTGSVSVTGEPEYKATLTSVVFDGGKMTAKYDFTPEPAAEVVLAATFTGDTASGTWSLREKASANEVASGTWKVKRGDKR
jgi:hypothetical protein